MTKVSYSYDSLGQLKRENNVDLDKTIVYTYDNGGNITTKTEYPYTTETALGTATKTITYGYDTEWKDKLTSYDGQTITYDAIGNPLIYRNGMSFTWQGRQMKNANLNGTSVSYKYNSDGLRSYKKVGETVSEYEYLGDKLVYEKRGSTQFHYRYDASGTLASIKRVKASGSSYTVYVICNSRGDIDELRNENGSLYARYVYDTWGNTLHILDANGAEITNNSSLAVQNPFRYRGYYYDSESGLYYVSSRYYDPEIGRFINTDSQLNAKDGILGYNSFAYCNNNPIMYSDPSGHSITLACIIVGAVIGGLAGGHIAAKVSKAQTGKVNGWAVAGGIVGGGVLGGLAGWGVGATITAIGATATSAAGTVAAPIVEQISEKTSTALQTYYPPNNGFSGAIEKVSLDVGTIIQRTGDLSGRFTAPAGTPSQMLSLPYDKIGQATTYLQTTQPVQALSGTVAPWFGQIGGGTQYLLLDGRVDQLLEAGILKIFGE